MFSTRSGINNVIGKPNSSLLVTSPPVKGMADTPKPLAEALVQALGHRQAASWLDPCAGSGRLIDAAIRAGIASEAILAVDLQTDLPALRSSGVECLLGIDFLQWAQTTERTFDCIIANPPFVRLRELEDILFRPATEIALAGVKISATANYWVAFLVAGLALLEPGGALAYILPAAWEYADYAGELRKLCADSFRELDVHRVAEPMFETVDDGSVLLVGRGFRQKPSRGARGCTDTRRWTP